MKRLQLQTFIKLGPLNLVALFLLTVSCTNSDEIDISRASKSVERGYFRIAASYYERVRERDAESEYSVQGAREAARISLYELKDFNRAIKNFKHLVLYSKSPQERNKAQKQIASIYFDNLTDYGAAIVEYNRLLQMSHDTIEEADYRIAIARAYYHQGQFFQAQSEANEILRRSISSDQRYETLLLKGNIKLAMKDYRGAANQYTEIFEEYPTRAKKEDLIFSLVLANEELGEYEKAISSLRDMMAWYKPIEFLNIRIQRLEVRLRNQPKERIKK